MGTYFIKFIFTFLEPSNIGSSKKRPTAEHCKKDITKNGLNGSRAGLLRESGSRGGYFSPKET